VADGGGGVCMPCLLGDYCPNGTVNSRASSGQVLCPDGEVCTPDIQGFNVEDGWTLKYNTKPCPEGTLCPAGSSEVSLELGLGDCQACSLPSPVRLPLSPDTLLIRLPIGMRSTPHTMRRVSPPLRRLVCDISIIWLNAKYSSSACVRRT
jgi:hypothetical protein